MEKKIYIALLYCREITTEHRRLAEIIEMIHTASLIHDDVLDDSDMRRGGFWKLHRITDLIDVTL